jgi:hypothetical protein
MEHTVMINASRTSHGNFIDFLDTITCAKSDDGCGSWFSAIIKSGGAKTPCFPFAVVSRDLPIERDGWQRGEAWDELEQAVRYEVDVYITYRVKAYGSDAEMLLLDLQQMFLRDDVMHLHNSMVGGRVMRTSDVTPRRYKMLSEYVDEAWLDVRIGFVDVAVETELCDLSGSSYIASANGVGQLQFSPEGRTIEVPFDSLEG